MEKYIVAALTASLPGKYEQCVVVKENDVIIATHSKVFGPDTEENCKTWMKEHCGESVSLTPALQPTAPVKRNGDNDDDDSGEQKAFQSDPRYINLYYLQYGLIALVTVLFVVILWYGIYSGSFDNIDKARGLITYLVAVSTVGIATLAILTAMVVRDFKERFAAAKEVLTILVGILGTIIGFYFGQAASGDKSGQTGNLNTEANKPANTNTNTNTNTNVNTNTNTNANKANTGAVIFRAPLENGKYVTAVYDRDKKRLFTNN